jgi:hypothetical protein
MNHHTLGNVYIYYCIIYYCYQSLHGSYKKILRIHSRKRKPGIGAVDAAGPSEQDYPYSCRTGLPEQLWAKQQGHDSEGWTQGQDCP